MMKKVTSLILILGVCVCLLSGCRLPFGSSSGLSDIRYEDAERYTAGGASLTDTVERVKIDWVSGSVRVTSHAGDTVEFAEEANRGLNDDTSLYYWLDGTTLRIKFCRSGKWSLSGLEKDLTLYLPEELALKELEVDGVSAELEAAAVRAEELKLETVSGGIRVTDCSVAKEAELFSVSGSIDAGLPGTLEKLKTDTVSGRVTVSAGEILSVRGGSTSGGLSFSLSNAPRSLEVDTVSGSVELYLPEDAGFTLRFSTVSGELSSDLPCRPDGKEYVCGDGAGDYSIGTTSGDVTIRAVR